MLFTQFELSETIVFLSFLFWWKFLWCRLAFCKSHMNIAWGQWVTVLYYTVTVWFSLVSFAKQIYLAYIAAFTSGLSPCGALATGIFFRELLIELDLGWAVWAVCGNFSRTVVDLKDVVDSSTDPFFGDSWAVMQEDWDGNNTWCV